MYYFDNAATTQPTEDIIRVAGQVAEEFFANPSSAHQLGVKSHQLLTSSRQQIAQLLDYAKDEIYFLSSGTEANNFVFQGVLPVLANKRQINRVLISSIEHPATLKQVAFLKEQDYEVELIPVDSAGVIELDKLKELLTREPVLISTIAVNNEVGSVQPLEEISKILSKHPQVIWHVDGVQAVTTQFDLLIHKRIDMVSLSSHKFHSIRGTGILAMRERVPYRPLLFGGGQEQGLRSSTENLPAIVTASRALRLAVENQRVSQDKLSNYRKKIIVKLEENGWQVFAKDSGSQHIICAALSPIPGEVLLHAFEAEDIYVSTTSACASRSHRQHASLHVMGVPNKISQSAIRISMSQHTQLESVNYLLEKLPQITQKFK